MHETVHMEQPIFKYWSDVRIFKAVIRPILSHAAETRPNYERTSQMMEGCQGCISWEGLWVKCNGIGEVMLIFRKPAKLM